MKILSNQRGYALLIVMFTIIIFLSVSAVIMSASMNHRTQEKTVDQKNQAVIAAELGTKFIEIKFTEKIKEIYQAEKTRLEQQINGLKDCENNNVRDCKSVTYINELEVDAIDSFKTSVMGVYKNQHNLTVPALADDLIYNIGVPDPLIVHEGIIDNENYFKYVFNINGQFNSKVLSLIDVTVNVPVPNFLDVYENENTESVTPIEYDSTYLNEIFFNPPISDGLCSEIQIVNGTVCKIGENEKVSNFSSKFNNSNIDYSTVTIIADSFVSSFCDVIEKKNGKDQISCLKLPNKVRVFTRDTNLEVDRLTEYNNITLITEAEIDMDKASNNYNGTIILKGLSAHQNFKNIRGNVLIIGNNKEKVSVNFDSQVDVKSGSFCLNLDGIDIQNSDLTALIGTPHHNKNQNMFYYYSKNDHILTKIKKYTGSYSQFVKECLGINSLPDIPLRTSVSVDLDIYDEDYKLKIDYK